MCNFVVACLTVTFRFMDTSMLMIVTWLNCYMEIGCATSANSMNGLSAILAYLNYSFHNLNLCGLMNTVMLMFCRTILCVFLLSVVRVCFRYGFANFVHHNSNHCHHLNVAVSLYFHFCFNLIIRLLSVILKMSSVVLQLQWRTVDVLCSFGVNIRR